MIYHHFDNVRSYASKGVADVRSVPPRWAKEKLALASQCKNTKKGDYIDPAERRRLKVFDEMFAYITIEPFKLRRTCLVKLEPWSLKGKIIAPDEFLRKYYGISADSWYEYRRNWKRGIKRQPISKS